MLDNASLAPAPANFQLAEVLINPEIEMEPAIALDMLKAVLDELSTRPTNPRDLACPVTDEGEEKKVHNELVEAAYHYVKAVLNSSYRVFEKAREDYAKAHIKVGKVLHEVFFNSTLDLTDIECLHPYKARARSWKSLMAKTDEFLRPSAVRNLLRCAAQDKWLEEENVDTKGLNYTHLVLLSRQGNDNAKKELIARIQREGLSVRQLQELLPREKSEGEDEGKVPPTLGESLTATEKWIKQYKKDKFLEDITTIHELAPKLAIDRLKQINDLMRHLDFAMERLRYYRKELKEAAGKSTRSY
jgi:DNA-binding transcriptional MerR regulator